MNDRLERLPYDTHAHRRFPQPKVRRSPLALAYVAIGGASPCRSRCGAGTRIIVCASQQCVRTQSTWRCCGDVARARINLCCRGIETRRSCCSLSSPACYSGWTTHAVARKQNVLPSHTVHTLLRYDHSPLSLTITSSTCQILSVSILNLMHVRPANPFRYA